MTCTLVVAVSKDRKILGYRNADGKTGIPWGMIPADNAWFRGICLNANLVIGRTTFDEVGKFAQRWTTQNVYVCTSRKLPDWAHNNVISTQEPDWVITNHTVIIGGLSIYKKLLCHVTHVALTEVAENLVDAVSGDYTSDHEFIQSLYDQFELKRVLTWTRDDECMVLFGGRK